MIEPVSIISNLSGAITAAVTASNLVLGLRNCPEEVKTCFSLVKLVHADIQHVVTLRTQHRHLLARRPVDAKRIDDIITSASESLTAIGSLVERLRADAYGGKVPYPQKLRWVLGDAASFALRTRDLQAQHAAVQGEISWLRMLELMESWHERAAEPSTSFDNLDLWKGKDAEDEFIPFEMETPFVAPRSPPRNIVQTVPSAETLAGSVSDASTVQPGTYVTQWVEGTQVADQGYARSHGDAESHGYAELPGCTEFARPLTPSVPSRVVTPIPVPVPIEEQDDELGSFFRGWKEEQAERKRENAI